MIDSGASNFTRVLSSDRAAVRGDAAAIRADAAIRDDAAAVRDETAARDNAAAVRDGAAAPVLRGAVSPPQEAENTDRTAYREMLRSIGTRILEASRTELLTSMHFLGAALGSLDLVMDLSTFSVGTDAAFVRFNPKFLMEKYIEHPFWLNRLWMHLLLHCLFRHMYAAAEYEDRDLWNLCCDIAAESVVDSMEYPVIARPLSQKRSAWYEELGSAVGTLTAQRLYRYFSGKERNYPEEAAMQAEFGMDDHSFWERLNEPESATPPQVPPAAAQGVPFIATKRLTQEEWRRLADKVRVEVTLGREAAARTGSFVRFLQAGSAGRTDYRKFLEKFLVLREEAGVDPDSFDYGYYNYGMELYGNMPLIEENEFREARKVEELVIVLDTSASCQEVLVQEFLNETAAMLLREDLFFRQARIRILECDDRVQHDIEVTNLTQMKEYAKNFCLKGGFGTDFRPAFAYVEQLRERKEIAAPRGLMYFTDGKGIYPKKPTDYETAFVFVKEEDPDVSGVPDWAEVLYV